MAQARDVERSAQAQRLGDVVRRGDRVEVTAVLIAAADDYDRHDPVDGAA